LVARLLTVNLPKAVTVAKGLGALIAVIAPVFSAWMFIDARYAHEQEMIEMRRQLEIRDNENHIYTQRVVTQSNINEILGTIDNYDTIDALNGPEVGLSPAQVLRKTKLERALLEQRQLLQDWTAAENALRLQLSPDYNNPSDSEE